MLQPALQPTQSKRKNWLIAFFTLFAFLGFLDASYLTISHYGGLALKCNFLEGCEIVTSSAISSIAGIPIALLGALYYLLILALLTFYFDRRNIRVLRFTSQLSWLGFLVSVFLVGAQIFWLKAFCEYCMYSAISSTMLFLLSFPLRKELSRQNLE